MEFDILNNVEIQVKDKYTGEIRQTVKTHNKATRNLVYGVLNFLSGSSTADSSFDAKKYIPCYVGFGDGGIEVTDESIISDPNWTETVNYNDTHLVREIPNSRSRIRKQTDTFQKQSGEFSSSSGDIDSVVFYAEVSPSSLCDRKLVEHEIEIDGNMETVTENVMIPRYITELGLFADNESADSMLAHVKFSNNIGSELVEKTVVKEVNREVEYEVEELVPHEVEKQIEEIIEYDKVTITNYSTRLNINSTGIVSMPISVRQGQRARILSIRGSISFTNVTSTVLDIEDDGNGNLICVDTTPVDSPYANIGDVLGTIDYDRLKLYFDTSLSFMQLGVNLGLWAYPVSYETYYTETIIETKTVIEYEWETVTETKTETITETITETELVPVMGDDTNLIYLKPNDIMTIKWVITIASIGPNNIFDNKFIYDENGNPVDNAYDDFRKSLSNIIVISDNNN